MQTTELPAELHCKACEHRVRRGLGNVDGVGDVVTNLKAQTVKIAFDPTKVTQKDLEDEIARQTHPSLLD
jgi:Cu+-exporting ATPase